MWVQAVNFRETLKCIAKTVVGLDVSLDHPPHVGYMHDWFAACLIQKVIRGKIYRRRTAERLGRPISVGFVQVRRDSTVAHLTAAFPPTHTSTHMPNTLHSSTVLSSSAPRLSRYLVHKCGHLHPCSFPGSDLPPPPPHSQPSPASTHSPRSQTRSHTRSHTRCTPCTKPRAGAGRSRSRPPVPAAGATAAGTAPGG